MKKEVNQSSAEQKALIAAYEAVRDLLPETPRCAWNAWLKAGERAEKRLSYLESLRLWNRL